MIWYYVALVVMGVIVIAMLYILKKTALLKLVKMNIALLAVFPVVSIYTSVVVGFAITAALAVFLGFIFPLKDKTEESHQSEEESDEHDTSLVGAGYGQGPQPISSNMPAQGSLNTNHDLGVAGSMGLYNNIQGEAEPVMPFSPISNVNSPFGTNQANTGMSQANAGAFESAKPLAPTESAMPQVPTLGGQTSAIGQNAGITEMGTTAVNTPTLGGLSGAMPLGNTPHSPHMHASDSSMPLSHFARAILDEFHNVTNSSPSVGNEAESSQHNQQSMGSPNVPETTDLGSSMFAGENNSELKTVGMQAAGLQMTMDNSMPKTVEPAPMQIGSGTMELGAMDTQLTEGNTLSEMLDFGVANMQMPESNVEPETMDIGAGNIGPGTMDIGAGNIGPGTIEIGAGNIEPGTLDIGVGNIGPEMFEIGAGDIGPGTLEIGAGNIEPGTLDIGVGNIEPEMFEIGAGNIGSETMEIGAGNISSGTLEIGSGNIGPGTLEIGSGNIGPETMEIGAEPGTLDIGTGNIGSGTLDIGVGNIEQGTFDIGVGNIEQGTLDIGVGNIGPETLDIGVGNVQPETLNVGTANIEPETLEIGVAGMQPENIAPDSMGFGGIEIESVYNETSNESFDSVDGIMQLGKQEPDSASSNVVLMNHQDSVNDQVQQVPSTYSNEQPQQAPATYSNELSQPSPRIYSNEQSQPIPTTNTNEQIQPVSTTKICLDSLQKHGIYFDNGMTMSEFLTDSNKAGSLSWLTNIVTESSDDASYEMEALLQKLCLESDDPFLSNMLLYTIQSIRRKRGLEPDHQLVRELIAKEKSMINTFAKTSSASGA